MTKHYSDDDLLETLDRLSRRRRRPPSPADIDALTPHAASTYRKRFGPAKKLQEALFKYRLKKALRTRLARRPPASRVGEATRTLEASGSLNVPEPARAKSNPTKSLFRPAPADSRGGTPCPPAD